MSNTNRERGAARISAAAACMRLADDVRQLFFIVVFALVLAIVFMWLWTGSCRVARC